MKELHIYMVHFKHHYQVDFIHKLMLLFLKLKECDTKPKKRSIIDSVILDKDLFLHFDLQGALDFIFLRSAWAPYKKDKPFYVGYFTFQKTPTLEFYNEFNESATPFEI